MGKRFKIMAITLALALSAVAGMAGSTSAAGAVVNGSKAAICNGVGLVGNGTADCTSGSGQSGVGHLVAVIINLLSWVVGIIAIIMIIVAGLKYITSGGSSEKLGSAKNTLIYALIGIAIVVLAQFLVHFTITTATNTCPTDNKQAFTNGSCKK